jgi:carbon monoxide dehydrogenase subunit G
MASIHREVLIDAPPEQVWAAVRDVGAAHERLVPGVLTDTYLDGDCRVVTFASGAVVRELLVDVDDEIRRFAYAVVDGLPGATHHHASMQVFAAGTGSRLVWITDVLPDALVAPIAELVELGAGAMRRTLFTKVA